MSDHGSEHEDDHARGVWRRGDERKRPRSESPAPGRARSASPRPASPGDAGGSPGHTAEHGDGGAGATDVGESKRQKQSQACYRCGGRGHIASFCASQKGALEDGAAGTCGACDGRGHEEAECPTVVEGGNPCYLCRQPGHFARECPGRNDQWRGQDTRRGREYGGYAYGGTYGGAPAGEYAQRQAEYSAYAPAAHAAAYGYDSYGGGGAYGGVMGEGATQRAAWTGGAYDQRGGVAYAQGAGVWTPEAWARMQARTFGYGVQREGEYPRYYGQNAPRGGYAGGRGGYGRGGFAGGGLPGAGGGRAQAAPGSGRCFRCNGEGHWTRDCPQRPPESDPNGCYKCGKLGHLSKTCKACYLCYQEGHRAVDCPVQKT